MLTAEAITPPLARHGEGPSASPDRRHLLWLDMTAGDILVTDLTTTDTRRWPTGRTHVALIRPVLGGGYLAALDHHAAMSPALHQPWQRLPWRIRGRALFNDGGCDPSGRLYLGTADPDDTHRIGRLYQITPSGPTTILSGVTTSNGLAWAADPNLAYYIDSGTGTIDRLHFDMPDLQPPRREPWVAVDPAAGVPDGMTVDTDGGVWVALWGGGTIHRYDPDSGSLTEQVTVSCPRPTSCAFGGSDLSTLYITTSQLDTDLDTYPDAGALHAVDVGTTGRPAHPAAAPTTCPAVSAGGQP